MRDQIAEGLQLSVDGGERGRSLLDQLLQLGSIPAQLLLRTVQLDKDGDLRPQDRWHDRRKDEIDSAELISAPGVGLGLIECGHEDDRGQLRPRALAYELGGLESIHDRHANVEKDHRELLAQQLSQSVSAG